MDEKSAADFLKAAEEKKQKAVANALNEFVERMAKQYGYVPAPHPIIHDGLILAAWKIVAGKPKEAQEEE